MLGLGTKTPWLGLEKDIGECTRSGQERKIGSSNRANKNEPEKLNFFCYLLHKAGINDYKTLTMWIQNGLITISQNKDTVAEKIWVVYQSHQAEGFTLLQ